MTSIVILNYNTPKLTIDCIESIRKNTASASYEIIVVDNGSRDNSVELLKRIPKEYNVKLILSDKNCGFAGGCNIGMRAAEGEEICLLNSDTLVTPNWLKLLKDALYSDDKIGIVGPVTNCAYLQQISAPNFKNKEEIYNFAKQYTKKTPCLYNKRFNLIFFCALMKREVYERIGGLDENFFPGNYEDDDYSLRARMAGFKLIVAQNVFIFHYGNESFKKIETESIAKDYSAAMKTGYERLIKKYGLSQFYKLNYTRELYKEKNQINNNLSRILLINTGATAISYDLLQDYPKAEISIVTDEFMDALVLTPDFSAKWCKNTVTDLWNHIDGKYDLIYAIVDIIDLDDWETFVRNLFNYLIKGGVIMLYVNKELKSFTNE